MKRVMLRVFLCASPLMLLFGIGVYSAERRQGNDIRIYSTDEEIRPVVASVNRILALLCLVCVPLALCFKRPEHREGATMH